MQSELFFNKEEYAKRLIGNAFSVPVIDILLRELQSKFERRVYMNYAYEFAWKPKSEPGEIKATSLS